MNVMYQQAGRLGSALIGIAFSAFADVAQPAPSTINPVHACGQPSRGVSINAVGAALPDARGTYGGLDVDTCRASAAAVLIEAT